MKAKEAPKRILAARAFTFVEDMVYLGLGLLLGGSAFALLVSSGFNFVQHLWARSLTANIVLLFQHLIVELAVLTVLIVALVVSLVLLRKRGAEPVAERAT